MSIDDTSYLSCPSCLTTAQYCLVWLPYHPARIMKEPSRYFLKQYGDGRFPCVKGWPPCGACTTNDCGSSGLAVSSYITPADGRLVAAGEAPASPGWRGPGRLHHGPLTGTARRPWPNLGFRPPWASRPAYYNSWDGVRALPGFEAGEPGTTSSRTEKNAFMRSRIESQGKRVAELPHIEELIAPLCRLPIGARPRAEGDTRRRLSHLCRAGHVITGDPRQQDASCRFAGHQGGGLFPPVLFGHVSLRVRLHRAGESWTGIRPRGDLHGRACGQHRWAPAPEAPMTAANGPEG